MFDQRKREEEREIARIANGPQNPFDLIAELQKIGTGISDVWNNFIWLVQLLLSAKAWIESWKVPFENTVQMLPDYISTIILAPFSYAVVIGLTFGFLIMLFWKMFVPIYVYFSVGSAMLSSLRKMCAAIIGFLRCAKKKETPKNVAESEIGTIEIVPSIEIAPAIEIASTIVIPDTNSNKSNGQLDQSGNG
jgi:hypothetical protein